MKKQLLSWLRVPIGGRKPERSDGTGTLRSCLMALLMLFAVQGAWAGNDYSPTINKTSDENVSITENALNYAFNIVYWDYNGNNYYWDANACIKVNGETLCTFKDLLKGYFTIGEPYNNSSGSYTEAKHDEFYQKYTGKLIVTRQYTVGNTVVYVSASNPRKRANTSYSMEMTIDVAFERYWVDFTRTIKWEGRWWNRDHTNYTDYNEVLYNCKAPTVSMPTITKSNFTRTGNKKVKFTYPSYSNYSGWSTQTIMYWEDCTNSWLNPSQKAYGTLSQTGEFSVGSNYEPVTLYPRFEYYKNANYWGSGSSGDYVFRFDKNYGKDGSIVIPGQPRPKNVTVSSTNTYNKNVTITWERDAYNSSTATDGKWVIFRKKTGDASTQVKLTGTSPLANTTYSYTDTSGALEYGTQYTYTVCYQPNGWTISSEGDAEGLSNFVRCTLNRDFAFSGETATAADGKITFSWSHNAIADASATNKYTLYVQQSTDDGKNWTNVKTIEITSTSTTSGSYTLDNPDAYQPYKFRAKMTVQGIEVFSAEKTATSTAGSTLTNFTASRGTYNTSVKLAWTVNQKGTNNTYFTLQRRPMGSTSEGAWANIYNTSGTATSYSYDDQTAQPGSFNEYRLKIFDTWNGKLYEGSSLETDGFCLARGVMSGRITYGSGTAVEGARITLNTTNADGEAIKSNRSLYFDGTVNTTTNGGSGLTCETDAADIQNLFGKDFTIQMWVKPDVTKMTANDNYELFDLPAAVGFFITKSSEGYKWSYMVNNSQGSFDKTVDTNKWTHLTWTYSQSAKTLTLYTTQDCINIKDKVVKTSVTIPANKVNAASTFGFGNWSNLGGPAPYAGYMDEVRIFNRCLSEAEILKNCNHTLNGSEEGLMAYYPFDEGMAKQTKAYDFSRQNGVSNEHHMRTGTAARSEQNIVPSEEQLSLMTYTDKNGNYMVRGIPFSGDGTNYIITPSLGIHEFAPTNQSRFVSINSLNFSSIDFEDISSFPVSGTVYYEGTDIPVDSVQFFVDGAICAKDGVPVMTGVDGSYTIDVPIGDHYITASRLHHTFVNGGRYPEDNNNTGLRETFMKEMKGVDFYDNTMTVLAGRVVGGAIERDKQLGFGLSKNNIGQARITLQTTDEKYHVNVTTTKVGTTTNRSYAKATVALNSPSDKVHSTAWRNATSTGDATAARQIVIKTDPATGEYAVLLPPLRYEVVNVEFVNTNPDVHFDYSSSKDEVNVTRLGFETTDTLKTDKSQTFTYLTRFDKIYTAPIDFKVIQEGCPDGAFGLESVTYNDAALDEHTVGNLYTISSIGKVGYPYGAPIFQQGEQYTFNIEACQTYKNYDGGLTNPVVDTVPMDSMEVTASNGLSDEQFVAIRDDVTYNGKSYKAGDLVEMQSSKFYLDAEGKGTYAWTAGFPDLTSPYNHKGFYFTYNNGEQWPAPNTSQPGIILGCVPTGVNFTTAAPDVVEMVLRDPPGTNSSATWEAGTTVTTSHTDFAKAVTDDKLITHLQAGFWQETEAGLGVVVVTRIEAKADLDAGVHSQTETGDEHTVITTTTLDRAISTSAEPEYVGAQGDVFIGRAKNYLFGAARTIGFKEESANNYVLDLDMGITRGVEYGTYFNYTQNYIENTLLPNLEKLRDAQLIYNENPQSVAPVPGKIIFVTNLKPGDYGYGSSNDNKDVWGDNAAKYDAQTGPSYRMIIPRDNQGNALVEGVDSIKLYNNNIKGWHNTLAANEEAKVRAKSNRNTYLDQNISFDSGSTITQSMTQTYAEGTTTTEEYTTTAVLNASVGALFCETGLIVNTENEWGKHEGKSDGKENENHSTVSYSLVENGDDDAISVDVFKSADAFSPIFITRAGQTCCPYEGARYTKYYKPGYKLDEATMQIEQPHILIDNVKNAVKSGVANGSTARFNVTLTNTSEIDEDVFFDVFVPSTGNANAANVGLNGEPVSVKKVSLLVPAGEAVNAVLTVDQIDPSIQDYDSIAVVIASQCQQDPASTWEVIADTAYVSVHYVATSSPVTMQIASTTVNTSNTDETAVIKVGGYDLGFNGFKGVKLQYKYANDAAWTTFKEYHASDIYATQTSEQLPEGGLTYFYDMKGKSDGRYTFRAMSTSTFKSEDYNVFSDEITVIKDMQRPQLLGLANPSDGILSAGEEISVNFNEDIRSGAINELTSFEVIGELNEAQIDHNVGLKMEGSDCTAYTQADVTLGNRSFSVESWVNIAGQGTLFAHGKGSNKFALGADADGHLVATIGEHTYTSVKAMPLNKWAYLMVSYNYDEGASKLSANIATDDQTIGLFGGESVADYSGNGNITLGNQMTGAIQELTLWDSAHTLAEALEYMHITKKPTEPGLIGYWKFDEGNGTVANDVARSRHMTLTAANWYLNNKNKAVTLDGSNALQMDITAISSGDNDDYAFEMWFKGSDTNKGATLFATSVTDGPKMAFDADGMLTLSSKGATTQLSKKNYLDNAWHHVALNVLRGGTASVYVDGTIAKQISAKAVAALQGYALFIGADKQDNTFENYFTGSIDEVRLWHATLNGKTIQSRIHNRLQGNENGLVAYYPFEAKTLDSGNQVVVVNSPLDNALDANGRPSTATVVSSSAADIAYSDDAPALKPAKNATNLDFSYVASERKIVFSLNNTPDLLEGTTVQFTVKNVADVNGNYCLPIVWTAYIRQNQLLWLTDNASVKGEQGSEMSFTAQFENTSGQNATWALLGLPSWLTASETAGTVAATKQKTLTFTVDPSTAIGKYESTIYLYGDNQIYEPFTVSLNVTGETPNWEATPGNSTMTIVGVLNIDGHQSEDTEDMVAAFRGTECVGVAHPKYFSRYDSYMVMLNIYGENKADLTYKAYDASTGTIYPSVEVSDTRANEFVADKTVGTFNTPVTFTPLNEIEQDLSLNRAGWKWFSLYAMPKDAAPDAVFKDALDAITTVTDGDNSSINWIGGPDLDDPATMYKLNAVARYVETIVGTPTDCTDIDITLNSGWSWIGYPCQASNSLKAAFAYADPQEGDQVKSQTAFSIYTDNEWIGTLTAMVPGEGYLYNSMASAAKTFNYPKPEVSGKKNAPRKSPFKVLDSQFCDNMTMIAVVMNGDEMVENAEVSVYAGTELRGQSTAPVKDGKHFLTIGGKSGEDDVLTFVVTAGESTYYLNQTELFHANAMMGTMAQPYVLQLGGTTGVNAVEYAPVDNYYDLQGRKVENAHMRKGVYINQNKKVVVKK
ncbi:MAG: hypothetical protein IKZ48_04900 [Prevotella sp.]|nr:hypothetical protein [Prevotella sp.]